ncbi:sigma-54-dependent transcriptional regulator [Telmatospirillum siberiense]|uniref:Sigma-54-dependent Fis family transcriptional regulator n=1 Tax=Telmatospirillum siberiense TaxID=382514 RepID=A0A2N3PRT9_9PROT|nr:sigma-54 dependent transcriptional regulator [Telmatospirillum siberiense]PKU23118.1 sigma-54-dependent Fis family transcriptional regulator [Telmatospirillum siberiense]
MTKLPIVLVIDDEVRSQESLRRVLADEFEVLCASSASEAEALLEVEMVHAILCDQKMPDRTGVDFLKTVRHRWPDPVRMIISGFTDSEDIIAGLNEAGIYQYITKPWDPVELIQTVKGAVRAFQLQRENQNASIEIRVATQTLQQIVAVKRGVLKSRYGFERIVRAPNSPMADAIRTAEKIAGYDISVLITGESGTGKELLARALHYNSPRADKPFIIENCAALPDQLLESELFGSKKGAFTGAYEDRIGLFEQADGGTIFLDEIGETSPAFQVKLLRVLQEGEIRPLGARLTRKVDVRVISATNRNLEAEVQADRFRRDLYYRLAAFRLHLPALRDRPMDVPLLAELLLDETTKAFGKVISGFSDEVQNRLKTYDWPGNVRELQNEIQRMVALAEHPVISAHLLSPALQRSQTNWEDKPSSDGPVEITAGERLNGGAGNTLRERVETLEEEIIRDALNRHRWNISRVADELGLSRVGLRAKLQRYGLERMN